MKKVQHEKQLKAAELQQDSRKIEQDAFFKAADLELTHNTDIPNEGL